MPQQHQRRWGASKSAASGYHQLGNNNNNGQHKSTPGMTKTGKDNYYGPQSTERDRESGPRNPGHASAIASSQPHQGNTPLQLLTGKRSGGGEASSSILGTQGSSLQNSGNRERARFEMTKTIPTEPMEDMLRRLQSKDLRELTRTDFTTKDSNTGRSILLTLLVNTIIKMRPELGEAQRARIAAHAAVHHPMYLHEALLDGDAALELTKSFLATRPVKWDTNDLCPMDTPYLIVDTELRECLGQLEMTPSTEMRRIITPFLQCFYPHDWELLEQAIRAASDIQLQEYISIPGAMHSYFVGERLRCTFDPPQWLSLSAFQEKQSVKPPPSTHHETSDDDDDDSVDSTQVLHPLREMRIDQAQFDSLPPEVQKKQILAVFPTRMASVLPAEVFGYMIVMLSEMSPTSIHGAMDPLTFHRLTKHASKTATKAAKLTPAPQLYYYRFRVQHLGKGYRSWANDSTGAILRSWIQAWIPMFAASRYTLTLTKSPSDRNMQAIDLSTVADTPTAQVLESYVYDVVRTRQGHIYQFDFWILTECSDVNNNGAQTFTRSHTTSAEYQEAMRRAAIWSMKMERLPKGYIPCIFLGNSLLKDEERLIKEEILIRTGFGPKNEDKFEVEWITLSTKSEHVQTMAHCILTKPEDHQLVSTLCKLLDPIQDVEFPVTAEYQPMILPQRRGPEADQELSQAIARHQEYTRALTQVSIKSLPRTSMCNYIPLDPGMEVLSPLHHPTVAYLVMNGTIVKEDGTTLASPVTRVNMDSKRTRLFMHAPRSSAGQLVLFARGVYRLLSKWYEEDISQATLDVRDADKLASSQGQNVDQAQQRITHSRVSASDDIAQSSAAFDASIASSHPIHPSPQQMVAVPQDQWNQAVQLLRTSAEKMDKLLSYMEQLPTVISHKDALDEAVSVITQSMTLNSDLVNNRADLTIMDTRRTLAERVSEVNDQVSRMGSSMGSQHEQIVMSMTQVLQLVSEVMSKVDKADKLPQASTVLGMGVGGGEYGVDGVIGQKQGGPLPHERETQGGESETVVLAPTADITVVDTTIQDCDQTEAKNRTPNMEEDDQLSATTRLQEDATEGITSQDANDEGLGGGLTEPEEDWERKYASSSDEENEDTPPYLPLARCHACNKFDDDIVLCDHCEIPHHNDCLIKDPNGRPNRYCNDCIKMLHGEDQVPNSQPNMHHSDLELSEEDSTSSGNSGDSDFKPATKVAATPPVDDITPQNTASKYSLRERKKTK